MHMILPDLWKLLLNTPRTGEVYNLGGGKNNTCSILGSFYDNRRALPVKPQLYEYVDKNGKAIISVITAT